MITTLRHSVKLQIFRCATKLPNRLYFYSWGLERSAQCLTNRRLHDMCPPPPGKSVGCGKNVSVLKARDCSSNKTPPPPPPPPPKEPENNTLKYLISLVAVGGIAGLVYYFIRSGGASKKKSGAGTKITEVRVPASSADIPKHVPYLLIGGGTASFSAFRAIKSHDPKAKVLVITNEYHKPYMRPPLSKELWYHAEPGVVQNDYKFKQWNGSERSLFFEPDEFYIDPTKLMENENGGVAVAQGYEVKKVDPSNKKVTLSDGYEISYDECLIATGCTPKSLDVFTAAPKSVKEKITRYRTPSDFEQLKKILETKKSITVIGSGFLGSELACAVAKYGKERDVKVYQIFYETGNMAKILPEYLSKWTTNRVEQQGVCVVPQAQVTEVTKVHDNLKLTLSNGKSILTDHVVVCVGCEANTEIASVSGLEVDRKLGGFVVNAELEARRNLFVAGDAACFYDPLLGRRRVEHHDNSVVSGRLAGENMVGKKKPYQHQSMFWSDLGPNIGYEGIGLVDSSLPTVGIFAKQSQSDKNEDTQKEGQETVEKQAQPAAIVEKESEKSKSAELSESVKSPEKNSEDDFQRGVIFYLRDNKIVGILLWNIFNRVGLARQIINENKTFDDLNEVAKLFEIHS